MMYSVEVSCDGLKSYQLLKKLIIINSGKIFLLYRELFEGLSAKSHMQECINVHSHLLGIVLINCKGTQTF